MAGNWSAPGGWPTQPIHMIHLPPAASDGVGPLLFWDFGRVLNGVMTSPNVYWWDGPFPGVEADFDVHANEYNNVFCAGHCHLSDGKVIVGGGHEADSVGMIETELFYPFDDPPQWVETDDMANRRWYPTFTQRADNKIVVMGGSSGVDPITQQPIYVDSHEIWDPGTGLFTTMASSANRRVEYYPWNFVLPVQVTSGGSTFPAGSIFCAGPTVNTAILDMTTAQWSSNIARGSVALLAGSAVMYLPGKIMVCGGAPGAYTDAAKTTYTIDLTATGPTWQTDIDWDMNFGRRQHNLVLLPDGRVLAIGGLLRGADAAGYFNYPYPRLAAEIWDPTTKLWTPVESETDPRWYHSVAMLRHDATIAVAGGNGYNTAEIYTPDQYTHASRPVISSCPSTIQYATPFTLALSSTGYSLNKVTLLKLGAVTHGFDQSQRFLNLTFAPPTNGSVTVTPPANANYAPPGYYMLFALYTINGKPVPSLARYVRLTA